ncbi:MAG: RagB/SusD family nutrient uptake outer membrane protein, partial [Prevotella sp.]
SHDLTSAPTVQQIWTERRKEFMGEGIRYWDLRRQGLDAFVQAELGQAYSSGQNTGTPISVYNNTEKESIASTFKEDNIRSKRGFFQIPKTQIDLSGGVYEQNAGWE